MRERGTGARQINETLATTSKTRRSWAGIVTEPYPSEACPDEGESKLWVGVSRYGWERADR